MFKSLNTQDGTEVVILDHKWLQDIERLRVMAKEDLLVCQGCNHPVGVRAGQERRPHFAHKSLGDCAYVEESLALRNARAVLYEWLVCKFGGYVTIEKKIDTVPFPRPIDCWVEKDSKIFAYWIFDRGLRLEKRMQLLEGFQKQNVNVNYVFSSDMLSRVGSHTDSILLTTTEREFLRRSDYDLRHGNTIHYLDPENRKIITFRELCLVHQPQVYSGHQLINDLEEILVSPKNGEFVHKGEHEQVRQHRKELAAIERRRKEAEIHNQYVSSPLRSQIQATTTTTHTPSDFDQSQESPESITSLFKEGVCVSCGKLTTDWFSYWVENGIGMCKCNLCMREGIFC
jgi:hypothetical protein